MASRLPVSALGNILGIILYGLTSDCYIKHKQKKEGIMKPEYRLVHMLLGSIILPAGFFVFGWTALAHIQWVVPLIGTGLIGLSCVLAIIPAENLLVDAYELQSASAVAAQMVCRALVAAILPLATLPLYKRLGLGWGNSLFGFMAMGLVPVVGLLMKYGEQLRFKSLTA